MSKKIIITSTGRCGTTFIMQILTELGYDTGSKSQSDGYNQEVRAGLEIPLPIKVVANENYDFELKTPQGIAQKELDEMPRILKSPDFSSILKCLLENKVIEIEHIIIPIRDVTKATESRIKAGLDLKRHWINWGVEEQGRIRKQKIVLYGMLGRLMEAINLFDLKYTFIKFPEMIYNGEYLLSKLKEPFPEINTENFWRVFNNVAKPEFVTVK